MKRSDQTDNIIGQCIGPNGTALYRLVSLLGRQTGRRTFLAIDTRTQQKVVVKLLLFGPDFTWDDLKLFEREAETLKSLEHPAIPQYLDSFEVETLLGEGFALVQTYIEAKSIQEWVTGGYRFGEQELKIVAGALLAILQYLHSRHPAVVHRDIKPSNVLLSEQMGHAPGRVYLVDFGSVQATGQGATMTVVGTYGYMPPEQFGGRAQPASDLYSLGATLIYLITGQHPAELTQDNLQITFTPPDHLSHSFIQWIQRLTSIDLSKRTASAQSALQALKRPPEPVASEFPVPFQNDLKLPFQSAHKEIKVFSTPHELEVQFSSIRLQDSSFVSGLGSVLSMLGKVAIFIVGLAIGRWLFFLAALVVWPMMLSRDSVKRNLSNSETAHLNLWKLADGSLRLDLSVQSYRDGSIKKFRHYTSLPVVAIAPSSFGGAVLFDCEYKSRRERNVVSISGDAEDVQWLIGYIDLWTDGVFNEVQGLASRNK